MLHPLINKLLGEKEIAQLSPEMKAVLEKMGAQLDHYEKQIKFLEHTSKVVEDEYESLYQQLKETNNRLNNFLEQSDIIYYISYQHKKSKNYFTSNWSFYSTTSFAKKRLLATFSIRWEPFSMISTKITCRLTLQMLKKG